MQHFRSLHFVIVVCFAVAITSSAWAQEPHKAVPKKVIYETDMCLDVDDVGALAMLHALMDEREAEILAVCFNEVHEDGAAAIDAINTWYGRGDIPVGVYKGDLSRPDSSNYLEYVARFPNDLTNETAPSALDVYLETLAKQRDKSVTIISVGFLNNIYDLLMSDPDLISKKVAELVVMGGLRGDNFNLVRHDLVDKTEFILRNWPTKLVISQEGDAVLTGERLEETLPENPVREAYYRFFGGRFEGRPSWDQFAVLYGIRGTDIYFDERTSGTGSLQNGYEWEMVPGFRTYLGEKLSNSEYLEIVESLMIKAPSRTVWDPTDLNFDTAVNAIDVQIVINVVLQAESEFDGDVDGNGTRDAIDVQMVINAVLGL